MNSISESDIEKYYPTIAEYAGLSNSMEKIGKGYYGVAYKCGDKTLKITQDEKEAYVALKLIGKQHPNVYNINNVFKINKLSNKYDINTYGIVYDYINVKGSTEDILSIFEVFNIYFFAEEWPGSEEIIKTCKRLYYDETMKKSSKIEILKQECGLTSFYADEFMDSLFKYFATDKNCQNNSLKYLDQMKSGLDFIKKYTGIIPNDIGEKNVLLKDDDNIVFIDLGITDSSKTPQMPILESDNQRKIILLKENKQKSVFELLYEKGILDSQMPDKVLGRGTCGEAFKFGNLVVKITDSCDEAATAFAIIGKKLDNVYNVRHVFKAGSFRYVIIYDYLENINQQQKAFVDSFWDCTANIRVQLIEEWSLDLAKDQLERAKQEIIKEPFSESVRILNYMDEPVYYFIDGFFDITGNTEKMEEFIDGLLESNELKWFNDLVLGFRTIYELTGYVANDVHRGNVLQDKDGKLIIIDIGRTDSRQEGIPEIS